MSLPIHVDPHPGYKANERPRQFHVDENPYEIETVEDRWQDPTAEYFKVCTTDGKRYLLRYAGETNEWTLQSGFHGTELLARPNIEVITVDAVTIRQAESQIAGCERCRPNDSDQPFNCILSDVLDRRGMYEFVLTEPAYCPRCHVVISETTIVEPQGGIEVETLIAG